MATVLYSNIFLEREASQQKFRTSASKLESELVSISAATDYQAQHQTKESILLKEFMQNPMEDKYAKRSLDVHLEDISCSCSLRDFYTVREVFQRDKHCKVTGVLLEIKDPEIAANFLPSYKLEAYAQTKTVSKEGTRAY